jgi:hypothetical protein
MCDFEYLLENSAEFECLTAVVIKNCIFWGIMVISSLKVNGLLGGLGILNLQGRRKDKKEISMKQAASRFIRVLVKLSSSCTLCSGVLLYLIFL